MNLQHLDGCEVRILDHSETVQVDFVKNSKIFIGAPAAWVVACIGWNSCMGCSFLFLVCSPASHNPALCLSVQPPAVSQCFFETLRTAP